MKEKQVVRRRNAARGREGDSAVERKGRPFLIQGMTQEVLRKEGPSCGSFQLLPGNNEVEVPAKKMEKNIFLY